MKLDAQEIKQLVDETSRKREGWAKAAEVWMKDWQLCRYDDTRENKFELEGIDTIVSPDPFNVINLLQRFVADEMRVEVPSLSVKEDDADRSEMIAEFLVAFDQESNRQQGCNHIVDKTWQSGVLGRGASQVLWIGDVLPKGIQSKRVLPIWRRKLEPQNVGVARGPYWTDYAFHKYKTNRAEIEQRYPKFKLPDEPKNMQHRGYWNNKYTVVDWWCLHKGAIWHAVVIDGEFAKKPAQTDYPDIPIIEHYADGAPVEDELSRSLSILHPIHELWKMKCDLMSKVATGLLYHYDPLMVAKGSFSDEEFAALKRAGPGEVIGLRGDQSLEPFSPQPNVPMAQAMLAMVQTGIDQATFPGSTYGDAPGGVSAGYAINSLIQQSRSRANVIRSNIEASLEAENQLILGLIEQFAGDEGVEIYGRSQRSDRGKPLKLTAKIIKGNYANRVMLIPEQPMDDTQKIMSWSGLVEKGIVSEAFMRDRVLNVQMPRNEETTIRVERALKSPQMQLKADMRALQDAFPEKEWDLMFLGTEYEQLYQQEKQWLEQEKAREEAEKEARKAEKERARLQELLAQGKAHMMPDGTIMEGSFEEVHGAMMPPNMSGGMGNGSLPPGIPPGMMPPLPPGMNGMDPNMGMPPGMPPMPPDPSMMGMPPQGDMQPPGLPGVPPAAAGQMTPEMLGIPPGAPPGMFDQLMGGAPPSDEEMLRQMLGGGGMPPPMV